MIIVLGESVLAASFAIQGVLGANGVTFDLVAAIVGSLLIVYSIWWIYFDRPDEHLLDSVPTALAWNYLHLPIFAAGAAVGAGLVVAIEEVSGHAHLGRLAVGAIVGAPIVVYLLSLVLLYARVRRDLSHRLVVPLAIALTVGAIFTPAPVLAIGLVLTGVVAVKITMRVHDTPHTKTLAQVESIRA
jgi:low temperature requirement protein LtrA